MPVYHLRTLMDRALRRRLIQDAEIGGGAVVLRLLGDWIDMDERSAVQFLQTLIAIDEESRQRGRLDSLRAVAYV